MANTFYLKKGDTYPDIMTILSDNDGPVDLTDCTITFRMSEPDTGNLMIEELATIVEPQTGGDIGKCYYSFTTGDTDIIGEYMVEWKVEFANGKIATFPRGTVDDIFNKVIIQAVVD